MFRLSSVFIIQLELVSVVLPWLNCWAQVCMHKTRK